MMEIMFYGLTSNNFYNPITPRPMSNDKHTPTPWMVDKDGDIQTVDFYFDTEPILIANVIDPKDAARIVQCVNEYDGLIETIATLRAENDKLELVQTDLVFENQVYRGQIEELRSEKAELIEALRRVRTYLVDNNDVLAPFPNRSEIDNIQQTLAKYETK